MFQVSTWLGFPAQRFVVRNQALETHAQCLVPWLFWSALEKKRNYVRHGPMFLFFSRVLWHFLLSFSCRTFVLDSLACSSAKSVRVFATFLCLVCLLLWHLCVSNNLCMVTPKCDFHLFGVYSGRIVIFREAWGNHEWTPRQSLGHSADYQCDFWQWSGEWLLNGKNTAKIWTWCQLNMKSWGGSLTSHLFLFSRVSTLERVSWKWWTWSWFIVHVAHQVWSLPSSWKRSLAHASRLSPCNSALPAWRSVALFC